MFEKSSFLITGGTGSFGTALVNRFLTTGNTNRIVVYSRDEYKQAMMRDSLFDSFGSIANKVEFVIGDIRDAGRLLYAMDGIDCVVHAAAMKQVPTCETHPSEAVKTNILGAMNVVDAALKAHVKKVVGLSTDKAVAPVNLYGATKLASDRILISSNSDSCETLFSVVRYGNVADSRGSVIPIFRRLVSRGAESLPITDFRMTRFFISLDEAVDLVILALEDCCGGEIYVSKLPSFKITDLALALAPNLRQVEVGIRPGEKLHEELVSVHEGRHAYDVGSYYIIYPEDPHHWCRRGPIGDRVPEGFSYNSGLNDRWLTVDDLRGLVSDSTSPAH